MSSKNNRDRINAIIRNCYEVSFENVFPADITEILENSRQFCFNLQNYSLFTKRYVFKIHIYVLVVDLEFQQTSFFLHFLLQSVIVWEHRRSSLVKKANNKRDLFFSRLFQAIRRLENQKQSNFFKKLSRKRSKLKI